MNLLTLMHFDTLCSFYKINEDLEDEIDTLKTKSLTLTTTCLTIRAKILSLWTKLRNMRKKTLGQNCSP